MSKLRVGVLVPSSNTVVEKDFSTTPDARYSVHTARMYLAETTAAKEREMLSEHAPRGARDLASAKCDVLVFACTSAGALLGIDGEAQLIKELGEITGTPVISTNEAVAQRIHDIGAKKVAVFTAYVPELNKQIKQTLQDRGVVVTQIEGMGITDNFAIAEVDPQQIVDFVRSKITSNEHDAIFISCTNLPAIGAIEQLSAEFKVPVITSNSATIDAVKVFVEEKVGGVNETASL